MLDQSLTQSRNLGFSRIPPLAPTVQCPRRSFHEWKIVIRSERKVITNPVVQMPGKRFILFRLFQLHFALVCLLCFSGRAYGPLAIEDLRYSIEEIHRKWMTHNELSFACDVIRANCENFLLAKFWFIQVQTVNIRLALQLLKVRPCFGFLWVAFCLIGIDFHESCFVTHFVAKRQSDESLLCFFFDGCPHGSVDATHS